MEHDRRTRYERGPERTRTEPPGEPRRYSAGQRPPPAESGGPPQGGPPPEAPANYQSAGPPAGQPGYGAPQPAPQPPPGPRPGPPARQGQQTRLVGEQDRRWERPPIRPVTVDDVVQEDVVTVQPDTPIRTVVASMAENRVGTVVVVEDDRSVGIVTDRMVALALESDPDVASLEASDLMTEDLVTVQTGSSVDEVLGVLSDEGIRRVPVVDDRERLRGIVSLDDLVVLVASEFDRIREVVEKQAPRF